MSLLIYYNQHHANLKSKDLKPIKLWRSGDPETWKSKMNLKPGNINPRNLRSRNSQNLQPEDLGLTYRVIMIRFLPIKFKPKSRTPTSDIENEILKLKNKKILTWYQDLRPRNLQYRTLYPKS